jgi:hypothetical protein
MLSSYWGKYTYQYFRILLVIILSDEDGKTQDRSTPRLNGRPSLAAANVVQIESRHNQHFPVKSSTKLHCSLCSSRVQRKGIVYKCAYVTWAFVWCLVSRNITQHRSANWISEWLWQGSTNLQKYRSHVKLLHTRGVKHSKFHTEDPKTFSVNVENLLVWVTWSPEFVQPWVMAKRLT